MVWVSCACKGVFPYIFYFGNIFFVRIYPDSDHQFIKKRNAPFYNVIMAKGKGVKGTGEQCASHSVDKKVYLKIRFSRLMPRLWHYQKVPPS